MQNDETETTTGGVTLRDGGVAEAEVVRELFWPCRDKCRCCGHVSHRCTARVEGSEGKVFVCVCWCHLPPLPSDSDT